MTTYKIIKYDMDEVIDHILKKEGGFVFDEDDSGGATNYGITQTAWDEYPNGLKPWPMPVERIQRGIAHDYYVWRFHQKKIPLLPQELWLPVFDFEVNAGKNAIRYLQRLVNEYNNTSAPDLRTDGVIGERTKNLTNKCNNFLITQKYIQSRIEFYFLVCEAKPKNYKFLKGWVKRAMSSFKYEREKNG